MPKLKKTIRKKPQPWLIRYFIAHPVLGLLSIFFIGFFLWGWFGGAFGIWGLFVEDKFYKMARNEGFVVHRVLVKNRYLTDIVRLRKVIGVKVGEGIFEVDVEALKKRLLSIGWLEKVSVERRLPDEIFIAISERKPVAIWQYKKKRQLIDQEGHVIGPNGVADYPNLIVLVGAHAPKYSPRLLKMLTQTKGRLSQSIRVAFFVSHRRWTLQTDKGLKIMLPEVNMEKIWASFIKSARTYKLMKEPLVSIDLRNPEKWLVKAKHF